MPREQRAPAGPPLIGGLKVTVPDSFEELFKGPPLAKFFEKLGVRTLARNAQLFVQWSNFLVFFKSILCYSLFSTRYPNVNQNLLYDSRATQNYVFSGFAFCEGCMSIFFCPLSSTRQDKACQNHAYDSCMPQQIMCSLVRMSGLVSRLYAAVRSQAQGQPRSARTKYVNKIEQIKSK